MSELRLDEKTLLRRYGTAKQREIERLLTQYGTSLKDVREMYPQLTTAIAERRRATTFPTQPMFFTAAEAAEMGLGLQEGWMLKMSPFNGGYKSSLITPQRWEITEDDLYISPTGERYSRADLEALLAMPMGLGEGLPVTPKPLGIEDLTEEGQRLYEEYQQAGGALGVADWLDLRERQRLETEEIFGRVFPEEDIQEIIDYIQANPEGFLADIREIGRTPETEALLTEIWRLSELPEITEADFQDIFGTAIAAPEYKPESWIKDVFWDPFWVGYINFFAGQRINFTSILPSVVTSFFEKTFWKLYPEDVIQKVTDTIQTDARERFLRLAEENNNWLLQLPEFIPNPLYSENPFEHTELFKDPGYYVYSFSSSLAYTMAVMGTLIGVSAAATPAAGIPAAMMVASGPEAHSMTEELVREGVPFEDAAQWGMLYGLTSGGIETASDLPFVGLIFKPIGQVVKPMFNTIFRGVASRLAKSILTGLVITQTEGFEELLTQVVHNAILKQYDQTVSILDDVSHAYIQGVIASLPFGAIGGYSSFSTFYNTLSPDMQEQFDGLVDDGIEAGLSKDKAQIYATNELAKTPEGEAELSKAIEAAQDEYYEEHPELTRPSMEFTTPEMAESVLKDIEVAKEITKKLPPTEAAMPEVVTYEKFIEGTTITQTEAGEVLTITFNTWEELKAWAEARGLEERDYVVREHYKGKKAEGGTLLDVTLEISAGRGMEIAYAKDETIRRFYNRLLERHGITIPTTPTGMPEAGLQPALIEGVPAREVRPGARGKLVQARLDDYLRLREYNKQAVADRIAEIKKALEIKGRLPKELGTKGNLRLELARLEALQELEAIKTVEELDHLIRQLTEEIGLREMPYAGYGGKARIDLLRSPTHRLFKGYSLRQLEEMMKIYQEARQTLSPQIPEAKPIPPPEQREEDIQRVKTNPTLASDEIIINKFIECIKDAKPAREITEALKHEELSRRSAVFANILKGGEGTRAFEKAKSALRGFLPRAEYILDLDKFGITDAEIERMIDKIRLDNRWRPFQKLNTYEAFVNLVMGGIPTEGQLVLLEKEFGSELATTVLNKMTTTSEKATRILQDVLNIPRTLITIVDLSASLRQGALLAVGQPVQFAKAFKAQLQVIFSEKNFKLIDEIVHNNVYAESAEDHKLYIAPIEETVKIEAREEEFRGRLIERVPIVGSIVRASERAYITMLNVLRMETYAYYCRRWEGTGKTVKDYDKLAAFINHATGRGDLGAFSRAGAWLSAGFFSPRFIMSRLQVPLDLINTTPAVRKVIARNLVSWVGANMLAIALFKLGGAETEDDPRSSDFGKIKIGNTRIDFWAGFQPYVRVIAQIILEERKSTRTGEIYEVDPIDIGVNFFRSKLAPVPGLLWDLKSGKTFVGEELTEENAAKIIFEKLSPIFIQDLVEAVRDSGIAAIGYGILSALGVGIQTYGYDWESIEQKLGLPEREDNLPYTVENEIYDVGDYYSEVGRMIGGATYEMLLEKNLPEKVLSVAQAKDILREIDLIPNKRLVNINADPDEGDTYEQYRLQWLARQKISNEKELEKFDKDYPDAYLGNITQAQYALLVQYHSLPESEQAEFLGKHPEIYLDPRDEWLRNHPEENAILALWGKAKIYSLEALDKVSSLVKSLDIPENALVFEEPDEVTKLKIKNQQLFDLLDAYGGLDDEVKDAEGLTARDRAIKELYEDNPEFRNDMRRIEALSQGTEEEPTPEEIVEGWVDRGIIVDEYGANSAEAKLWLIDNKEAHQWALDHALLTDDGTDWNEPVLRLLVQYRDDFDLYEAYGDISSDNYIEDDEQRAGARHRLLFDEQENMTDFGKAYYTREASSQGYSERNWPAVVEYSALPLWGSWRERFLLDNPDFYKEYTNPEIGNHPSIDQSKVKPLARDKIYKQFYDEFQAWDETGGMSPRAIENMRDELDTIEKGGISFKEARYRVQAYDVGFPEDLIDDYVDWYSVSRKDYEDDWWLMEHEDFYKKMFELEIWTEPRDFSKVPSREVWNLYQIYQGLPSGTPRLDFRAKHPELDAWLVSAKGYTPIKDRGRAEAEPTPWEELAEVERFKELFK